MVKTTPTDLKSTKKNATRWFTTIFKMLFFVSFEKQQLFCGPELTGDLGPGF